MNSYGFAIEDFFTNQDKSREFLEQIVERAEEEVGYKVESGMVSMQLMRMPDNSLTITFTDRGEDALQNMLKQIHSLAGMIDDGAIDAIMNGVASKEDDEDSTSASENIDKFKKANSAEPDEKAYQKHLQEVERKKQEKLKAEAAAAKIYKFESLHDMECFADSLNFEKPVTSRVYKDNAEGTYYLLIKKGKLKLEEYQIICTKLTEYASLCSQQPFAEQYCREHFECLIPKQALKILKQY